MSTPIFSYTKEELIQLLVIFLLGIIIGATLLNVYSGKIIDNLMLEKNRLQARVEEQEQEIEELQKHKYSLTIKKIVPLLDSDLNQHTQDEIINKIRDLLDRYPGRSIQETDFLLLWDVIHNRLIVIEDKTYQLQLDIIVATEELRLYLRVSPYIHKGEGE
ncbi:MAG TPA: hypothetical protein VKY40_06725 [Halanaerobiales bacterium]|nr:hypothetical protein [Halanaerobiales bacterium]